MITATDITSTSDTNIYVSSGESAVTTLMVCNHDNSTDAVVDIWVVPGTGLPRVQGTKTTAHYIVRNMTIVAGDTFVMDMEKLVLDQNDKIILKSNTANVVNSVISSMAVSGA